MGVKSSRGKGVMVFI